MIPLKLYHPSTMSIKVSRDRMSRYQRNQNSRKVSLFVRILFLYLKQEDERELLQQAKSVVRQCLQQHRCGNPAYTPLSRATLKRLHLAVGPHHWSRATAYYYRCCRGLQVHCSAKRLSFE